MSRSFIITLASFVLYTAALLLLVQNPSHALWLFGAGLPGLMTILLTGWLIERAGVTSLEVRSLLQMAGLTWQVGLGFVVLHACQSGGALTLTPASTLGLLWFGLWVLVTLRLCQKALPHLGRVRAGLQRESL